MAKYFDYQILAKRFVFLLMIMRFEEIAWHVGHHHHLNTTRGVRLCSNKKVLLCERKRHTVGPVASPWPGAGGTPYLDLAGG